jgi:glycosyltransferase involved in cell wall biosynthesis
MAEGGHMVIARELTRALRESGHEANIIVTPQNRFGRQASAYLATWLTDVTSTEGKPIDRVISLRYPSYAVRHPRHVCWLNHTMREYYDLWPTFSATLSPPSLASTVLYPPAPQRPYRCDGYAGPFLFVSRLDRLKRADLVIRALAVGGAAQVGLTIAGEGDERAALERLASELGVASRVTFAGRVAEDRLIALLATCRAVVFPPLHEDYGFVTVEAFASRKAVVTCRDSGGPAELVQSGVNGLVCDPSPDAIAGAMATLTADPTLAERLGAAAFEAGARLTWPDTVRDLVT